MRSNNTYSKDINANSDSNAELEKKETWFVQVQTSQEQVEKFIKFKVQKMHFFKIISLII